MQSDDILNFKQNMSELEELILQAKKVPLSAMCMVDKDRMSRILEALTKEMPTVFTQCQGVVDNQMSILKEASDRAEQTKQTATARANQLLNDAQAQAQKTVAAANQQAQDTVNKAGQQANAMLQEAQERAQNMVQDAERRAAQLVSQQEITARAFGGILLVVSNPVDVLTYAAWRMSGLPKNRVLGSGTVLDTGRLKQLLGEKLEVDSRNVHAFIIGEHGDSEIAAWSSANVSGIPIHDICEMRGFYHHEDAMREIAETVKNSAYEIIAKKKATYYGIAMSVRRICEAIVRNEKSILPLSVMLHGQYGLENVVLSMPAIVGSEGVETTVPIELNREEQEKLKQSAQALGKIAGQLQL